MRHATSDSSAVTSARRPPALLSLNDWSHDIARAYGPMHLVAPRRSRFVGSYAPMSAAGLRLASVTGNIARIDQPRAGSDPQTCDWFLVTSVAGRTLMTHRGESVALDSGDFVLVCEADDRRMDFEEPFHHVSVRLTARFVAEHVPLDAMLGPRRLPAASRLSTSLSMLLRQLTADGCDDLETLAIRDAAYDLMGYLLRALADDRVRQRLDPALGRKLERARAAIEEHIADPELSAEKVASLSAMSVRTLHRVFAAAGLGVAAFVRERRLQRYRAALTNARMRHDSVTSLAYACGYTDAAYASRLFRERFGSTPSGYRAAIGLRD